MSPRNRIILQKAQKVFKQNEDSSLNTEGSCSVLVTKQTQDLTEMSWRINDPSRTNCNPLVRPKEKRKIKVKKTSKKRLRNVFEWVDVKSKKLSKLGLEHENRKWKAIVQRKMPERCKKSCRLKCSEKRKTQEKQLLRNSGA
ncbi:hypothetical protein ILUMI_14525 [Ignelater luminosus]|uniref:Uncharacterized protein n=1 Tax=Ignelater luminosus TaxID=2038154 RepID=A0A8K0CVT4_IGNLU|nr:hypothetical protein ILUMI_14525 [Ignelater luminosus]